MTIYVKKGVFILDLTFKDRENIIRQYGNDYKKSKIIEMKGVSLLKENCISEKEETYIESLYKYQYYYNLQNRIDKILEQLDFESANFIKNEFLSTSYKSNWWMNYFSRSTYYRMKNKAMNQFLVFLYD